MWELLGRVRIIIAAQSMSTGPLRNRVRHVTSRKSPIVEKPAHAANAVQRLAST